MIPQLSFALVTLIVGWVALWPLRARLGPGLYHLAALPTGLLGWGFVASVSIALSAGYTWPLAAGSLLVFSAVFYAVSAAATRHEQAVPKVAPWTFLVWALVIAAFTAVMASWEIAVFSHDGWAQYELYSWPLFDKGNAAAIMLGHRMLIPSAFHAAYHLFGGEFASFVYPVLSLHIALLVGLTTMKVARPRGVTAAVLTATVVVVTMVGHVTYLFMSIYVHSHAPTALYLLLAAIGVKHAFDDAVTDSGVRRLRPSGALLAGIGLAGTFLSRPDGPAYGMAILLLAGYALLYSRARRNETTLIIGPTVVLGGAYILATIVNRGMWTSPKIDASTVLMFLALYTAIWVVYRFVPLSRCRWLSAGTNLIALVIAVEAVGLVWLFRVLDAQAVRTLLTMGENLLSQGGWRSFWPAATAMLVVSIVFRARTGRDRFTSALLFYLVQFFVIAFVVHGTSHPGRLGWGDSFNRVAFHAVPLIFLYLGVYAGGLVRAFAPPAENTEPAPSDE